jgi:hypothetical protein
MSVKYSQRPYNISTFSNLRPSKICTNWNFWFENKPSGNPAFKRRKVSDSLDAILATDGFALSNGTNISRVRVNKSELLVIDVIDNLPEMINADEFGFHT